jgi:asparagine synthase (glutamine-hydrolysing)
VSLIAGIIDLTGKDRERINELELMLEAMLPPVSSKTEKYVIPKCSTVLGRVAFGPDCNEVQGEFLPDDMPRVVWTGEIYNDEIDGYSTCPDFLIEKYRGEESSNFPIALNGTFAAAIADTRDGSVTLITDHTASCSIFTVIYDSKFYFASQLKGVLAIPQISSTPDANALLSLTVRGFYVDRRTLAENVSQMDYATTCKICKGSIESKPYWRYLIVPEKNRCHREDVEHFAGLLRQAVERRTRTGKNAILLSGGLDSRGILCCTNEFKKSQAISYTLRTKDTRHELGDWAIAEKIAQQLSMDFSVYQVDGSDFLNALRESVYFSEGAAGFIFENIWSKIREKAGVDYLLIGDECFGWTNGLTSNKQVLPCVGIYSLRRMKQVHSLLRGDRQEHFFEQSRAEIERIIHECSAQTPYDRVDELYMQQRLIHYLNPKRRVISNNGLGIKNPWLDLDILNFMAKTPSHYRIAKKLFRQTLRYLNPSLMALPRARDNEAIDYHKYIVGEENRSKGISATVLNDNPFLEEYFDISSLCDLIDRVSKAPPQSPKPKRLELYNLLPKGLRLKLGAFQRYIADPDPHINNVQLLCRIITVAESLRQLHNRFSNK